MKLLPENCHQIFTFSQAQYTSLYPSALSMGNTGYVYVPASCQKGACTHLSYNMMIFNKHLLHSFSFFSVLTPHDRHPVCKLVVAFHGCEMDIADIKDAFYAHSGLNQWAETNNVRSFHTPPLNLKCCHSSLDAHITLQWVRSNR
jgi:hypothetical protein